MARQFSQAHIQVMKKGLFGGRGGIIKLFIDNPDPSNTRVNIVNKTLVITKTRNIRIVKRLFCSSCGTILQRFITSLKL